MAENLGVAIDLSGGEVHTTTLLPTLSSSSESVFMESYDVVCYLRDLMADPPTSMERGSFENGRTYTIYPPIPTVQDALL
jgi:hypothetical protein